MNLPKPFASTLNNDSPQSDLSDNDAERQSLIGPIEIKTVSIPNNVKQLTKTTNNPSIKGFPEPPNPVLCCGSGCLNCIWLQYAEDVMEYIKSLPLHNGVVEKQKKIIKDALKRNVKDENLRIYLLMEIQAKGY